MFVGMEIIGAAGGASRLPYERNAGYIPLAVMARVVMLAAAILQ